jgi:hypothetical protein
MGNIVLAASTYDFYYKVAEDLIYIGNSSPTAVDKIVLENKATKVICNGQMYIIREGVIFNVLGQVVE